MAKDIEAIKALLQREKLIDDSENELAEATQRLSIIMQSHNVESGDKKTLCEVINTFINADDTRKRKILAYCLDFVDPTVQLKTVTQNGEEIQLNTYLQEDDLYKLYQFVKRHESDNTFGETVYKIMDKHQMTAPQVYKAALLRRQDFSRATDPKAKNVSKLIAWQIIIGLQCNMDEADEVLFSAGYIRRKSKFDLTMEYFIKHRNYDIMAINEALDELKLKVFSCYKSVRDNDNQ